jgi:hypothetical protein
VHHAVDAVFQFDERAVVGEVADLAADAGARPGSCGGPCLHGLVSSWRMPSEIFCSSLLKPRTTASTSWPTLRMSEGFCDALGPGQLGDVDEAFDAALRSR